MAVDFEMDVVNVDDTALKFAAFPAVMVELKESV